MTGNKLFKIYTVLYVFFATECMGLYGWLGIPIYSVTFTHASCLALTIPFTILIIFKDDCKIVYKKKEYIFAITLLLICAIELFATKKVAKSQSNILMLVEAFPYMAVIIEMYVFTRLVADEKDLNWLELFLEKTSLTLNILAIIQFIIYPKVIFLPMDNVLFRNELPRIYIGGEVVGILGLLISLSAVLQKKQRKIAYLNLVAIFFVRFIVTQGRAATLMFLAIVLIGIVKTYKLFRYIKILIYAILIMIVAGVFWIGDVGLTINQVYNADFSFMVRLDGIAFFWKKFLEYPIWGMGFITFSQDVHSLTYSLLSNARGYRYNRSDLGIFGLLNIFGITGIIWFTLLMNNIRNNGKAIFETTGDVFGVITFWYLLLTMMTLIVTDFQRIGVLPILLMIINKKYMFCLRNTNRGIL